MVRSCWLLYLVLILLTTAAAWADVAPQQLLLYRGVIALADGRAQEAVTALREVADLEPEDWRCQLLYAEALRQAGQAAAARVQYRRATLVTPSRLEPWQAMAQASRTTKDIHLELAACSGLMRFFPEDPLLEQRMAALYRAMGQPANAEKMDAAWQALLPPLDLDTAYPTQYSMATLAGLRLMAKDDPKNPSLLSALASKAWKSGNKDETREVLAKLCALTPTDGSVMGSHAHVCLVTGHIDEALQTLRAAAPLGDFAMDRALALWSLASGQYSEAIEPLQRLLTRDPLDPVLNRQLGVAALLSGDLTLAKTALRVSWQTKPDQLTAQHYATVLHATKEDSEAEVVLKRAIALFPKESMLKVCLAAHYCAVNRLELAGQLTQDAAQVRPEAVELTILAGERYLRANFVGRAYLLAAALRDKYPTNPLAVLGAVTLFRRLSAPAEAQLVLTRYLGPQMQGPFPRTEALLQVADGAIAVSQYTEARKALEEVLKTSPRCRQAYVTLGKLLVQQGETGEATRLYVRALLAWPNDLEFTLALARTAHWSGDYPLAIRSYQQAAVATPSAEPWLGLGDLYHRQGDEIHARVNWRTAQEHPGGAILARLNLLGSYESAGEREMAIEVLDELLRVLASERVARVKHWRAVLAARGFTPSVDELDALLLLEDDLLDPAPLQARLQALMKANKLPSSWIEVIDVK